LFDHNPYSRDLAPSDYHLFTYVKNWLGSQRLNSNEELTEGVKMWQSSQAADFFDTDIQKLIPQYDKWLNSGGDYVEKYLMYIFFIYNNIYRLSLFVLLTAHRRLLSEWPSYVIIKL
jgi:hypothetical protein